MASDEELFADAAEENTISPVKNVTKIEQAKPVQPPPETVKEKRVRKVPDRYQASFIVKEEVTEPNSVAEAKQTKFWLNWEEAMEREIQSQQANGTWDLVKRPAHAKILKNRWIFKIKHNPLNDDIKFKARLVVKGFHQVEGVDFGETFAPVVRYESVRTLFALAAAENLNILQFDVETAFLNSELDSETSCWKWYGMQTKERFVWPQRCTTTMVHNS